MGQTRRADGYRPLYGRRGCAGNRRGVRTIGLQHRTLMYRQGLYRREKSSADDRTKLDCMPDPFKWMGGKKNLQKTV